MLSLHENSIRKLRTFVTVVDSGGFSAAQTVLGTSSATISIQMKELEAQLGMTLCHRGRSGFHLTDQGQAVYDAAQSVLGAFSNFNLATAGIRDRLAGEVKIGLQANMATNPAFRLPETLRRFQSRDNEVSFRIEESRSASLQSRTLDGRYDLGIGLFPNQVPGLDYTRLFSEDVALYCACDHPLTRLPDEAAVLAELGHYPTIAGGGSMERLLHKPADLRQPTAATENMDASIMFVLSGQFLGFLPTHFARIWVDRGDVRPVLADRLTTTLDFHLITKRGGRNNNVVDVFLSDLLAAHGIG